MHLRVLVQSIHEVVSRRGRRSMGRGPAQPGSAFVEQFLVIRDNAVAVRALSDSGGLCDLLRAELDSSNKSKKQTHGGCLKLV